ncbi:hypothetical protein JRO89_XS03G0062900 [Xanthoceras sorbifolium]|uniref:AAA+ ATPase domain-containing protein n=1 Tax=Xanthoceras sorbifolium TaxID=99658 RepID=A0ABQ8I8V6_9ROSI|nr:hypothetical protein JRO89_XS03G0062900 [Xanthoceras sorbifolium]
MRQESREQDFRDFYNLQYMLKILLLCGPPGLGKTTLAHVAAKHCGYRVVEVNASDDRSSSAIETKILDVVQMNSVMADSRPKCLVIDEIDGALGDGKGAVEVSAESKNDIGKENIAKEERSGKTSSKKQRKTTSLSRPIICICNDLYAPALRPLRQIAKLKYICNKERMKTSSVALTALAEYTECDIRSCLNTLQFLNKKKETLNVLEISTQVVGRKDMSRSAFDIWKEIFQKRKMKRSRKSNNSCGGTSNEFESLHSLISYRGDYDTILDGIHENILQLQYHDPVMQKTVKCFNCLGVSDLVHQYVMRTQQMSLRVYLPSLAIAMHRLVAQIQKPNIEWPKSYHRYRTTMIGKMDIFKSWRHKLPPYISRHLSTKTFVEELISPLLHILSPPTLRPVALHLLSEKEKNDLTQSVRAMVAYCITYKNLKSDPLSNNLGHEAALDASALSFDPPISDFINFKGYLSGHCELSLAMKQVLVHEVSSVVDKQRIMQVSIGKSLHLTDGQKENHDLILEESSRAGSTKIGHAAACAADRRGDAMNVFNPRQCNLSTHTALSTLESSKSASASIKLNFSGDKKKPSNSSANFFDRYFLFPHDSTGMLPVLFQQCISSDYMFRKLSSKGSQNTNTTVQKATVERDARPLLFKFNEALRSSSYSRANQNDSDGPSVEETEENKQSLMTGMSTDTGAGLPQNEAGNPLTSLDESEDIPCTQQAGSKADLDRMETSSINLEKVGAADLSLGGTRGGKEEGFIVSSNSVGQSTQVFEIDGIDPTVVNSPKKRSWKRLPRNIAEGLPTDEVKLGKRAIILEAEEDSQNRKRGKKYSTFTY